MYCLNLIPLKTTAQIKSDDLKDFQLTKEDMTEHFIRNLYDRQIHLGVVEVC